MYLFSLGVFISTSGISTVFMFHIMKIYYKFNDSSSSKSLEFGILASIYHLLCYIIFVEYMHIKCHANYIYFHFISTGE
jgi:hypothetical protein